MRFHRIIYFLLLLLLCILATKSNKYIGYRKKKGNFTRGESLCLPHNGYVAGHHAILTPV